MQQAYRKAQKSPATLQQPYKRTAIRVVQKQLDNPKKVEYKEESVFFLLIFLTSVGNIRLRSKIAR